MKWIAIKDQLPPLGKEVRLKMHAVVTGHFLSESDFYANAGQLLKAQPTHWAEITPPEIEETK